MWKQYVLSSGCRVNLCREVVVLETEHRNQCTLWNLFIYFFSVEVRLHIMFSRSEDLGLANPNDLMSVGSQHSSYQSGKLQMANKKSLHP